MPARRISIVALSVVLALGGCGRGRDAGGDAWRLDTAVSSGPLVLLLDAPTTVRVGEEVPVAVTLVNRGAAPASIAGVQPDLVVITPDARIVWRRSRHEHGTPSTAITLRPNEMRGSGYTWDQRNDAGHPVPPDAYRIRAEAPALKLVSPWRSITIRP